MFIFRIVKAALFLALFYKKKKNKINMRHLKNKKKDWKQKCSNEKKKKKEKSSDQEICFLTEMIAFCEVGVTPGAKTSRIEDNNTECVICIGQQSNDKPLASLSIYDSFNSTRFIVIAQPILYLVKEKNK